MIQFMFCFQRSFIILASPRGTPGQSAVLVTKFKLQNAEDQSHYRKFRRIEHESLLTGYVVTFFPNLVQDITHGIDQTIQNARPIFPLVELVFYRASIYIGVKK